MTPIDSRVVQGQICRRIATDQSERLVSTPPNSRQPPILDNQFEGASGAACSSKNLPWQPRRYRPPIDAAPPLMAERAVDFRSTSRSVLRHSPDSATTSLCPPPHGSCPRYTNILTELTV